MAVVGGGVFPRTSMVPKSVCVVSVDGGPRDVVCGGWERQGGEVVRCREGWVPGRRWGGGRIMGGRRRDVGGGGGGRQRDRYKEGGGRMVFWVVVFFGGSKMGQAINSNYGQNECVW